MVLPIIVQLARRRHVSSPSGLALPLRLILVLDSFNTVCTRARTRGGKRLQNARMKCVR